MKTYTLDTHRRRASAAEYILNLPDKPRMEVVIRKYKPRRSLPQNDKLHAIIGEIAKHTGYTPDEMKGIVKYKWKIKHTSNLSKMETADLIEQLYAWGTGLGVEWSEAGQD